MIITQNIYVCVCVCVCVHTYTHIYMLFYIMSFITYSFLFLGSKTCSYLVHINSMSAKK